MLRLITFCLLLIVAPVVAHAATDWSEGLGYKARLVKGDRQNDGSFAVAFEVVLEDGWKTYWRVPGEFGIPPRMNFENSSNIKNVHVHWPAPVVFPDQGGVSIGYKRRMVLPVTIVPEASDQTVDLNMGIFFGVCSDICVPADERFSLLLDPSDIESPHQGLIHEALIQVPLKATDKGFNVASASLNSDDSAEYIQLRLSVPEDADHLTVLTEGPEDWYIAPYRTEMNENHNQDYPMNVAIPMHRVFKDPLQGDEELKVTLIIDGEAVEKTLSLK